MAVYPIIIGSGQLEKALATAVELNSQLGLETIHGLENSLAARSADLCILTVVQQAHRDMIEKLKDDLFGKILVDTTACVDFRDLNHLDRHQPPDWHRPSWVQAYASLQHSRMCQPVY